MTEREMSQEIDLSSIPTQPVNDTHIVVIVAYKDIKHTMLIDPRAWPALIEIGEDARYVTHLKR